MSNLRFGLIGCGNIASKHAQAVQRIEDAELGAFVDPNLARARNFPPSTERRPSPASRN